MKKRSKILISLLRREMAWINYQTVLQRFQCTFSGSGFLIGSDISPPDGFNKVTSAEVANNLRRIQADRGCCITNDVNPNQVFLFAKQAKSAKICLWPLTSLSKSNAAIRERSPSRDWKQYHCPYDLKKSLSNQFIVLSPHNQY